MFNRTQVRPFVRRGLTAFALAVAAPALQAFDISHMNDAERDAFQSEIRSYILANPEVLFEAVEIYEQQQQEAQGASEAALLEHLAGEIYSSEGDSIFGNPEGDIVFVEFSDYQCGYCKKAYPEVKSLLSDDGNIKLILKEYPILGDGSVLAARFALAAREVGGEDAYGAVHDALMKHRGKVTEGALRKMASKLDLDGDAILAELDSDAVNTVIARNRALGQQLQINGTPSFIMGDQIVRGYVPYDAMVEIVAELREAG